jgi:hypothetical protein
MDGFQVELLRRLPLAQAVLRLFGYALDPEALNDLYEKYRGRGYEAVLRFDQLVCLIRDALTVHQGSGHRAFAEAQAREGLPVAEQNVYGKLARIPEKLSMALLAHGTARLGELLPLDLPAVALPDSLAGLRLIALDGKKIKNAAKRLKVLRGQPGKLLGGKLLVALEVFNGLGIAMNTDPDGERNDVPLVPSLVEQVRQLVAQPILWIADRQFGNLDVPRLLVAREGDHFLVRCPKSLRLFADSQRPVCRLSAADGRTVVQEWGWIGAARDHRRRYVRRITLLRPQEEAIILVTDLTEEASFPTEDLLAAYLQRWGIERMFQQVTEVFHLQTLIGGSPRAMIFQAALCFLLYNLIQVVRAYLAREGQRPIAEVSSEKVFWDVRDQLATWKSLGEPRVAVEALRFGVEDRAATPAAMGEWLKRTLRGAWRNQYVKAPPKKRPAPSAAKVPRASVPPGHGGHSSTWRLLQAAKATAAMARRS